MNVRLRALATYLFLVWVVVLPLQTRLFLHRGTLAGGFWEYGTLSLYATDILLLVILALFLFGGRDDFFKRPASLPRQMLIGAAFFFFALLLSTFTALDVGVALGAALRWTLGMVALWLFLKLRVPVPSLAVALAVSASLESVLLIAQFTAQSVPASMLFGIAAHSPATLGDFVVETDAGRFLRPYGTLPHPNMAAGWLLFGLIAISGLYIRSKDRLERAVLLALFCLVGAGLFFTFSRGALFAWFLVLIVFVAGALWRERRHGHPRWHLGLHRHDLPLGLRTMKLVAVNVLLFGFLLHIFSPLVAARSDAANRLEARSINERVTQLDEARSVIRSSWLLGAGLGNYTKALHDRVDASKNVWDYQPVHNVWVLLLAEIGVFGAALVAWFLSTVLQTAVREHRKLWKQRHDRDIPWFTFANLGLLGLFLVGLADHYLWSLPFGVMLVWLAFGVWAKSLTDES